MPPKPPSDDPPVHREPAPDRVSVTAASWPVWAALALLALIRVVAARGELWFDEILSLKLASKAAGFADLLQLNVDNSHPLNSAWLLLVGPSAGDVVCRAFSLGTGIGSMIILLLLLHEMGAGGNERPWQAVAGVLVFGCSYLQILYASEARGYAPCVFFSLGALLLLIRGGRRSTAAAPLCYGAACTAAVLSHPIGIQAVLGGIAWSAFRGASAQAPLRSRVAELVRWHAAPAVFCLLYHILFLRSLTIVGGNSRPPVEAMCSAVLYAFGIPSWAGLAGAVITLAALAGAWIALWRRDRALAAFLLATVVLAPCLALLVAPAGPRYPRYWMVSCTFAQLLAAAALARALARSQRGTRLALLAALALSASVNAVRVQTLVSSGRAAYETALRHVRDRSGPVSVSVGGDHDMRHLLSLERYARRVARFTVNGGAVSPGVEPAIDFVSAEQWTNEAGRGPAWLLLIRTEGEALPPDQFRTSNGDAYARDAMFGHAPLSGWDILVYQRVRTAPVGSG